MKKLKKAELLKIPEVIEEIKRHLWIESEKAGHDIGFDAAAADWIKKYSDEWLKRCKPDTKEATKKTAVKKKAAPKKRRAKSYSK